MVPKISVVIPVYNAEVYLRRCVESLTGQTFRELEIILVNDGSTDSSGELADRLAAEDSRVRVIHTPNKGPADARHTGVAEAKGAYICFCDSDDYRPPEALEVLLRTIEEAEADLVTSDFWISKGVDEEEFTHYKRPVLDGTDPATLLRAWFNGDLTGGLWSVFFKRSLYTENIKDYLSVYYGEDGVVLLQLLCKAGKIAQSQIPTYHYILRHGSLSNFEREWTIGWMETYALVTRWKLDYVRSMREKEGMKDELAYFFLYRLSVLLLRGNGRAFDTYGVEEEIYREYYPVSSARKRLRRSWPKQWVFLKAEKNGFYRIVKKAAWGHPWMRKTIGWVKKALRAVKK